MCLTGYFVTQSAPSPLTARHAWGRRPVLSAGMDNHRNVARISRHTSLAASSRALIVLPPHTTSPGRMPRNF